jgi:hypothetical protein
MDIRACACRRYAVMAIEKNVFWGANRLRRWTLAFLLDRA